MTKLSKIKSSIGNWAQPYKNSNKVCYCGWMELHKDEPYGAVNKGVWKIRIVEADSDAVFVHRLNGSFVIEELSSDQIVSFRYDRWHGLLPRDVAKYLEGRRYWKGCKEYVDFLKEEMPNTYHRSTSTEQTKARLLWEFL